MTRGMQNNIELGTAIAYLKLQDLGFFDELKKATTAVQEFEGNANKAGQGLTNFIKAGDQIANVGDKWTRGITVPIANFAKSAVSDFRSVESAFTGVQKTMDAARFKEWGVSEAEGFEILNDAIWKISQTTSSTFEEVAAVMEMAGQLNVPAQYLEEFTKTMVMLGDSTNVTADEAAKLLAQFMNITKTDYSEIGNLGSAIVKLGNNSATTEADIIHMTQRLVSAAHVIGLSEQETLALATAMSSVGISAERGGSSLAQSFIKIEKMVNGVGENATEKLELIAKTSGMTAEEFANAWQNEPIVAIQAFLKGLGNVQDSGDSMIVLLDELGLSAIRQSDTLRLLGSASDLVSYSLDLANDGWEQNTALVDEASRRYGTLDSRLNQLNQRWRELRVELAEMLLPILEKIMEWLGKAITFWNGLDDSVKKFLVTVAGIVAVVGPVLSIGGRLISGIGTLIATIGSLIAKIVTVKKPMTEAGTAASTLGKNLTSSGKSATAAASSFSTFAGQALKLAAVAVVILAAAAAVKILTDAAIQLYNAGPGAIATFAGLTVAGIAMTAAIAAIGSACTATAPGLLALGAAVLMVSAGVAMVTAAIALLVKAFAELVEAVAKLVDSFTRLADKLPLISEYGLSAAVGIAAIGTAAFASAPYIAALDVALAALIITAGMASTTVGVLTLAMTAFNAVLAVTTVEVKLFGEVFVFTFNQMALAVNTVTETIIKCITNLVDTIITLFKRLKYELIGDPIVLDITNGIRDAFREAVDKVIEFVKNLVKKVVDFFNELWTKIKDSLKNIYDSIRTWFEDLLSKLSTWYEKVKTDIGNLFKDLKTKVEDFWRQIKQFASTLPEKFKNFGSSIFNNLLEGMKSVWTRISNWAQEKFEWITSLVEKVKNAARDLLNFTSSAGSNWFNGSHASGLDYVPFDGYVAELHKGERVLTKQENQAYNNGGGYVGGGDTYNFYNTKDDPYEYARQIRRTKREMAF